MKPIYKLNDELDAETIRNELTALIGEAAVMTDLLASVDEWPQQRLMPFAAALDRRMLEIQNLYSVLEN